MAVYRAHPIRRAARLLLGGVLAGSAIGCGGGYDSGGGTTTTYYVTPPVLPDVCDWLGSENALNLVPESYGNAQGGYIPNSTQSYCAWDDDVDDGISTHQLRLMVDREIDEYGDNDAPPIERAEQKFDQSKDNMLEEAANGALTNVRDLPDLGDEAIVGDYQGGSLIRIRRGVTRFELSYTGRDRSPLEVLMALAQPLLDAYPDPEPG